MKGRGIIALSMAAALTGSIAPARADVASGACLLSVTVTFPNANKLKLNSTTNASSIVVTSGTCAVTFQPVLNSILGTTITVTRDATSEWSCASVLASGQWSQEWDDTPPPPVSGAHYTLTGSPAALTMVILKDLNFVASVELVSPLFAVSASSCQGTGIESLTYTAVEVFQDP